MRVSVAARMVAVFVAGVVVGGGLMMTWRPGSSKSASTERDSATTPVTALTQDRSNPTVDAATDIPPREPFPSDPVEARSRISGHQDTESRYGDLRESMDEILTGGEQMVEAVLESLPKAERREMMREFAFRWLDTDPDAALAWIGGLDTDQLLAVTSRSGLIGRLAKVDPVATGEILEILPQNDSVLHKYAQLSRTWTRMDPQAAVVWGQSLEMSGIRKTVLDAAFDSWAITDPQGALAAAAGVQNEQHRRTLLGQIATKALRSHEVDTVLEWAEDFDTESRIAALSSAMGSLGGSDTAAGRELLDSILADPQASTMAGSMIAKPVERLAAGIFRESSEAATQWALAIQEPVVQQHAIEGIAQAWIAQDVIGASEWIGTLPEGGGRNGAIFFLVSNIERADPATAFQWAASVTGEPEKQRYLLQKSLYQWNAVDRAAAQTALNALDIPDVTRTMLQGVGHQGE